MLLGLLSGRIFTSKAVKLLGLRIDELWLLMRKFNINHGIVDEERVKEELDAYKNLL